MFQNKWCDHLENAIQCCVCFICPQPDTHIFQCINGHIVCQKCMIRRIKCPVCREGWSNMRHRLAEDLTTMVSNMKLELIGPEGDIHKLFCPQIRSVRSQTDKNVDADKIKRENVRSEAIAKPNDEVVITHVKGASIKHKWRLDGKYHCPVTGCRKTGLNNSSMIHHFLKAHGIPCMMIYDALNVAIKQNLPNLQSIRKPKINQSFSCQNIWEVVITKGMDFDRIFSWMNRTFYLKFFMNTNEDLIGYVNIIHQPLSMSPPVREFSYQLLLQCCIQHKDYKMECKFLWPKDVPCGIWCLEEVVGLVLNRQQILPMLHTQFLTCTVKMTLTY